MSVQIVKKDSFQIVGVKWKGTFEQAGKGEIRLLMSRFRERLHEIRYAVEPGHILGISQHDSPDGFTYYMGLQVDQVNEVPEGMVTFSVPSLLYAKLNHRDEDEVASSYQAVYEWIKASEYEAVETPINHLEIYPTSYNPLKDPPVFTLMIPVTEGKEQ